MTDAPRLLDLFCGAGGAAAGYRAAGFYVFGVDTKPQPRYAGDAFLQVDALAFLESGAADFFDAIHASPPCQAFTRAGHLRTAQGRASTSPDLIEPTRQALIATGLPYIIENVPGAPIEGVTLCGSSFGLRVRRHRIFESNVPLLGLPCDHKAQGRPVGVYYRPGDEIPQGGRTAVDLADGLDAMGVDFPMTWNELKESIPPAYTEHLGRQIRTAIERST